MKKNNPKKEESNIYQEVSKSLEPEKSTQGESNNKFSTNREMQMENSEKKLKGKPKSTTFAKQEEPHSSTFAKQEESHLMAFTQQEEPHSMALAQQEEPQIEDEEKKVFSNLDQSYDSLVDQLSKEMDQYDSDLSIEKEVQVSSLKKKEEQKNPLAEQENVDIMPVFNFEDISSNQSFSNQEIPFQCDIPPIQHQESNDDSFIIEILEVLEDLDGQSTADTEASPSDQDSEQQQILFGLL